ncbi:MAG: GIY-YIG nuclease family protein [Flavobacteriales bacterium]|nr:GIY-YIG nuclease family protein [Flavobacteriales bacterium]
MKNSYVYIITNIRKAMYYIGVTSSLERRLAEHRDGLGSTFTSKYNIHYLVYYEEFMDINRAIEREKQLKGWSRIKKEKLIKRTNPEVVWLDI